MTTMTLTEYVQRDYELTKKNHKIDSYKHKDFLPGDMKALIKIFDDTQNAMIELAKSIEHRYGTMTITVSQTAK